jgi:two-component SAPR family response regulator
MAYHKREKVIYMDDEEYVWCSREKEYIHNTEFEYGKNGVYKLFCEKCSEIVYDERNINYTKGAVDRNEYVEEQSKKMLENIGYDFNSEYTIHQQFLMKHNLV